MFDLGMSHLVVIAIVAILVLGPEKLPGFVKDTVRMWRAVRTLATDTQAKITRELLPDVPEAVRTMSPRRIVEHVLLRDPDETADPDATDDTDDTRRRIA